MASSNIISGFDVIWRKKVLAVLGGQALDEPYWKIYPNFTKNTANGQFSP